MKKTLRIAVAALALASVGVATPAFAFKHIGVSKFSQVHNLNKQKKSKVRTRNIVDPSIVAGSKGWLKRLRKGRGSGYNGGFTGRPG